ncbi:MAG: acyl carrier protein [Deltaproteobacteria bacterium]|nr:acyl carrier protein [Deltaproteobacteria bacterium]
MDDVEGAVRKFIAENFVMADELAKLANDASFLETGIIDSTGVLTLLTFIEDTYGITVDDAEMIPENLDSIERISAFVRRKKAA